MGATNDFLYIAYPSRPNAGRIYDYLLGGHHNFEVDRKTADKTLRTAPFAARSLKLVRWFLVEATERLAAEGYTHFIDFASGLPTMNHIHQHLPEGAKVIYSDIDPIAVEYAREILDDNPDVLYMLCDAGRPEMLLNHTAVADRFGSNRKVAFGFNGIAYFLSDERLRHALKTLYDWAQEGSKLFFSDVDIDPGEAAEKLQTLSDMHSKICPPFSVRTQGKLLDMAKPWRVDKPGPRPLEEWVDLRDAYTERELLEYGGTGFYGVILEK